MSSCGQHVDVRKGFCASVVDLPRVRRLVKLYIQQRYSIFAGAYMQRACFKNIYRLATIAAAVSWFRFYYYPTKLHRVLSLNPSLFTKIMESRSGWVELGGPYRHSGAVSKGCMGEDTKRKEEYGKWCDYFNAHRVSPCIKWISKRTCTFSIFIALMCSRAPKYDYYASGKWKTCRGETGHERGTKT